MTPLYAQDHDYSSFSVLAVDDVPINLILVQKMLARFNFQMSTAANGQAALDAVAAKKPDLILSPDLPSDEIIKKVSELF